VAAKGRKVQPAAQFAEHGQRVRRARAIRGWPGLSLPRGEQRHGSGTRRVGDPFRQISKPGHARKPGKVRRAPIGTCPAVCLDRRTGGQGGGLAPCEVDHPAGEDPEHRDGDMAGDLAQRAYAATEVQPARVRAQFLRAGGHLTTDHEPAARIHQGGAAAARDRQRVGHQLLLYQLASVTNSKALDFCGIISSVHPKTGK
jgi:hypothetical protein